MAVDAPHAEHCAELFGAFDDLFDLVFDLERIAVDRLVNENALDRADTSDIIHVHDERVDWNAPKMTEVARCSPRKVGEGGLRARGVGMQNVAVARASAENIW